MIFTLAVLSVLHNPVPADTIRVTNPESEVVNELEWDVKLFQV
jgi:hypothetical protein